MKIEAITSHAILDSRGRPTLETTVQVNTGVSGTAAVPAGVSTGSHEAVELRDGGKRFGGFGVTKAIKQVTAPIAKALKGQDVRNQRAIDQQLIKLDGTVNKSKLGSNASLSVSLAVARAAAALQRLPLYAWINQVFELPAISAKRLPRPMLNVINGGRHADTDMKIQEFIIIPQAATVAAQLEQGTAVYRQLGELLSAKHLRITVGDEGGFAPAVTDPGVALEFLVKAITDAGYRAPEQVSLGLDLAASEFYQANTKRYAIGQTKGGLSATGLISLLEDWVKRFPIASLEDPLAEDDWEGWQALTAKLGSRCRLVGDDLFVTNAHRLQRGIDSQVANAILIKPNQVGTLTETIETVMTAQAANYTVVVSHRSGETNDPLIADLAVAVGAAYLKAGAPVRGERVAKYNRLMQIAEELGQSPR